MLVLVRDGFQCQNCGKREKITFREKCKLEIHHINGPINNEWDNLITLCRDCHLYGAHNGDYRSPPRIIYIPRKMDLDRVTQELCEIKGMDMCELLGIKNPPRLGERSE